MYAASEQLYHAKAGACVGLFLDQARAAPSRGCFRHG